MIAEGEEELLVGTKKLKCKWTETTEKLLNGNQWEKTRKSAEVPGGLVLSEDRADAEPVRTTKTWLDSYGAK